MNKGSGKGRMHKEAATLVRLAAAAGVCAGLQGCVVVGRTSRGGFFIWPGGLGLLLMLLLLFLLLRRR